MCNMTIYKYEILKSHFNLELPLNSEILSAHEQDYKIYIWVKIDLNETRTETRKILTIPTGYEINHKNLSFIDTVFKNNLVFHVFENIE